MPGFGDPWKKTVSTEKAPLLLATTAGFYLITQKISYCFFVFKIASTIEINRH